MDRVLMSNFKVFLDAEFKRTKISHSIMWKLLPDDIHARYTYSTYEDALRAKGKNNRTISSDLANAIRDVYSKIRGRSEKVQLHEGLLVPPFGSLHSFSISQHVAADQLNKKFEAVKKKMGYDCRSDFTNSASDLLQVDVMKIFEKDRAVVPRLRTAILGAVMVGFEIPPDVLNVHQTLLELAKARQPSAKAKSQSPHALPVSEMSDRLKQIFAQVNVSAKTVYASMSEDYRKAVTFGEVEGWLDGQGNEAQKAYIETFLEQASLIGTPKP